MASPETWLETQSQAPFRITVLELSFYASLEIWTHIVIWEILYYVTWYGPNEHW